MASGAIDYAALLAQVDETIVSTQAERTAPQVQSLSDSLRFQHSFLRMLLGPRNLLTVFSVVGGIFFCFACSFFHEAGSGMSMALAVLLISLAWVAVIQVARLVLQTPACISSSSGRIDVIAVGILLFCLLGIAVASLVGTSGVDGAAGSAFGMFSLTYTLSLVFELLFVAAKHEYDRRTAPLENVSV